MASEQISMSPDLMRARAGEYTKQAENLGQIISKMDNLLKQLQDEWKGEASRAFAQRFTELRPGFVKAANLIDEISDALKKTAQAVEQQDREIARQY